MAGFCLPKEFTNKFLIALKDGRLDPVKLSEMNSAARRAEFSKIVSEANAKQVNALFETQLLKKNFEKGVIGWAKSVGGLKPEALRDLETRLSKMDERILDPVEQDKFLADLAEKKLGTKVSFEEVKKITELTKEVAEARAKFEATGESGFGAKRVALDNYVNDLKLKAEKQSLVNPFTAANKGGALWDNLKVSFDFIASNSRSIKASFDNSFWGRQGLRALLDPRYTGQWMRGFVKSWSDIKQTILGNIFKKETLTAKGAKDVILGRDSVRAGEAIIDGLKADIYESPNFDKYTGKPGAGPAGTKLDLGTGEEAYPTSLPSKVPILGRFFRASETTYEAGAIRLRRMIADQIYAWGERTGLDMKSNKVVGDLNEVINSITGRGSFGKRVGDFERNINTAFFSIKFFKSNVDYLLSPLKLTADVKSPARQLAAQNLLYTIAVTGIILKLAQTLNPKDNKDIFNPTSSNFGKIKSGRVTFDLTHGAGGIVVAASKILTQKTTSATTGKTTELGASFGSQTGDDILWNFLGNKLSPIAQTFREVVINNKTFQGEKPTVMGETLGLVTPIPIENIVRLKNESDAMKLMAIIADGLGISTNVSTPFKKK